VKLYLDKFRNRPNLHIIIANIGWLFLDKIVRMGVGLYVTLYIARYLGASQFGTFNYAIAFAAMFSPIATLGLDAVVIRYLVNDVSSKQQILPTVFWLKLIGSLGALFLSVGSIYLFHHNDSLTISLVAILAGVGVVQTFDTIDIWFQSQVESKYTVIAKNSAFILTALLKVMLIESKAPLITFAVAGLVEAGLGALGLVILFKARGNTLNFLQGDTSFAKKLLQESWPLILSGLSIMIYMRIDQIMLGQMIGEKAVGIYSAAIRISEIWYFIPVAIASSIAPSIYAAKKISEQIYYQRIKNFIRLMVFVSIVIAIPMTFLSNFIVTTLFGNEYIEAGGILAVHIWAAVFVFMGVATSPWFNAEELNHLSFHRTFLGAVINVGLNLVLIPAYGGIGASIATVISQAFASFLSNIISPETRIIFKIQLRALLPIGSRSF
jgi:polysaccharide transporter, PST family